jgi:hypothetical protein
LQHNMLVADHKTRTEYPTLYRTGNARHATSVHLVSNPKARDDFLDSMVTEIMITVL